MPAIADLATREVLIPAIEAGAWLIKPSRQEVAELLGVDRVSPANSLSQARSWLAVGAACLHFAGCRGSALGLRAGRHTLCPTPVRPYNSIGSGDTLVGALAATYVRTGDLAMRHRHKPSPQPPPTWAYDRPAIARRMTWTGCFRRYAPEMENAYTRN